MQLARRLTFEELEPGDSAFCYGEKNINDRKLRILVSGRASVMVPVHPSFMLDKINALIERERTRSRKKKRTTARDMSDNSNLSNINIQINELDEDDDSEMTP